MTERGSSSYTKICQQRELGTVCFNGQEFGCLFQIGLPPSIKSIAELTLHFNLDNFTLERTTKFNLENITTSPTIIAEFVVDQVRHYVKKDRL